MSRTLAFIHNYLLQNPLFKNHLLYLNIYDSLLTSNSIDESIKLIIDHAKLYPCGILTLLHLNIDNTIFAPYIVLIKKMLNTNLIDSYLETISIENHGFINRAFVRLISYTVWLNPIKYCNVIKKLISHKIIGKIIDFESWKTVSYSYYKEKFPKDNILKVFLEIFAFKKSLSKNYVYYNWLENKFCILNWDKLYSKYQKQLQKRNL